MTEWWIKEEGRDAGIQMIDGISEGNILDIAKENGGKGSKREERWRMERL